MKNNILSAFFVLVQKELKYGLNPDFGIPVRIDGFLLFAILFAPKKNGLSFGLFLGNQKYSRKTLLIKSDGSVTEDTVGIIPETDLTSKEPVFKTSNEEIAILVAQETTAVLTQKKLHTEKAQPFSMANMGSFGKAKGMLIKQFQFPFLFEADKDSISSAYLDRIEGWYPEDAPKCLEKYNLKGWGLEDKIRNMDDKTILDFLCEIMKVERSLYTGFRILGTVSGNGHAHYSFQLFSKHPESTTEVFSGDYAPNVLERETNPVFN